MNDLQIFNNPEFGEIRTLEENGVGLFCGSDVAKALGYARPNEAVSKHCKGTLKRRTPTAGGTQEMSFIPESDLYRLVFSSKLPTAEKFTDWVTSEVLPSIRKHGAYMTPETLEAAILNPDYLLRIVTALKDETDKRKALEAANTALTVDLEIARPKAEYFDQLVDRNLLTNFRETAKQLEVGELRFKVVGLDQIDKNLGSVVRAQARLEQANASVVKSEAAYAIQAEKTAQAAQKTAQGEAKLAAQREKTAQETEKTTQAELRLAAEQEKTAQAQARAASEAEKTARAQANLSSQTEKTSKASRDLFTQLGTNAAFRVQRMAVQAFTQSLKEAMDTMKAVDDQLVTVRKVTGATSDEIKQIREQAYETAAGYGTEVDAYLESVAAFARAGYKEKSAELAELSTKTQVVGDTTAETANQFLLAVDAAYKYEGSVEKLGRVLDGANEIDNNYATSIEKIAEGLGKIAPLASQTHIRRIRHCIKKGKPLTTMDRA